MTSKPKPCWCVVSGSGEIHGVFPSKEDAQRFLNRAAPPGEREKYGIVQWEPKRGER